MGGLFSERPHIALQEFFWDEEQQAATDRYYVINAESGDVNRYVTTIQGYAEGDFTTMLHDAGFGEVVKFPSLVGDVEDETYIVLVAKKVSK
jgi:hypothetical protein